MRKRAFTQSDGTLSNGYRELPATESNILRERKLEFVGEGIRYWDLLRQGIDVAANTIAASGERVISGGREETVTIKAENIKSKRGFCQIPLTQIQRSNNLLKQNAGNGLNRKRIMKINHYIYALAGAALMLFGMAACSPDDYDLGDKDVTPADLVEGQAYTITHDDQNPNIVYLKSLMADRYQVNWIEPQGRSQEKEVTLKIPFPGTYDVLFGVNTRGGYVYGDTAHFTVEEFCADFVNNELYTMLTGGVGQSKTWIPDNGNYGLCSGEISYGDPSATNAEWNNFTSNWDPAANHEDESGNFMKSSLPRLRKALICSISTITSST